MSMSAPVPSPGEYVITKSFIETYVTPRYGATTGDPNYDPSFDINKDGFIDVVDISWFGENLGKIFVYPDHLKEEAINWNVVLIGLSVFGLFALFLWLAKK